MHETFEHRLIREFKRRPLEIVAALYVLAILWGGLIPFDFSLPSAEALANTNWLGIATHRLHLPDAVANVAVFIPLGLLLRALLIRSRWTAIGSLLGAVFFCGTLSLVIEMAQAYAPHRSSSMVDLACNILGSATGASLYTLVAWLIEAWAPCPNSRGHAAVGWALPTTPLARWLEQVRNRPVALVAQLCAAVIAITSLVPFDFTISTNRFVASVRDTTLMPFGRSTHLGRAVWLNEFDGPIEWQGATNDLWQLRLDYVWTVFAYALLAVLLCRYLTRHCRVHGARHAGASPDVHRDSRTHACGPGAPGFPHSRTRRVDAREALMAIAACTMLSITVSFAQLFVMSRSADVTCILLALVGAIGGVLVSERVIHHWSPETTSGGPFAPKGRTRIVTGAAILIGAYITARQLAPFEFDASPATVRTQLGGIEWLPLDLYQKSQLPIAIDDLVHKSFQWAAVAIVICLYRRHRATPDHRQPILATAAMATVAAAILESAQLLLPARSPAITDTLLAFTASAAGVIIYRLAAATLTTLGLIRPIEAERIIYNVELGPPNQGPRERVPTIPRSTTQTRG